jgi:tetratricopeptide (TPR) repeat protein
LAAPWIQGLLAAAGLALVMATLPRLPVARASDGGDGLVVPSPALARAAALGFDALASDYYWLQAVQLVGRELDHPERHASQVGRLIDVAARLDPWIDHPYRFAALWMTDSKESVRAANALLERGIAYHPDEWRNRFYLSFNHFLYLGDDAAAADELEPAIGLPGAPRYLGRLVARLRSEGGGLDAAAAYLEELLRNAPDGYARADYAKALDEVETERRARYLDRARELFRARRGRDIERVEDLAGPGGVLTALPPEPNGWEWVLDSETDAIVSSYYGHRYELNLSGEDRQRREQWGGDAGAREGGDD